ncbi:MAG: NAD(P)-dependent oxidoreductase, partial [Pirellulaceae bacterium]
MDKIAVIGLGLVGSALSERFLQAGHAVVGFDIEPQRCQELHQRGGIVAPSAADAARAASLCVLSLPTSQHVETVLAEIVPYLWGKTVADTTTGAPEFSRATGEHLAADHVAYLDATIVGSSRHVQQGTALTLVGGEASVFEASRTWLSCFSTRSFYLGSWGSGASMKLVVNLVLGLNRAVLAEGLSFAERCALDPRVALEVLRAGIAYSRVMDTKGPKMIEREFSPEARLAQHHKDVRLILEMAERYGC